jgi:hypothetical protein
MEAEDLPNRCPGDSVTIYLPGMDSETHFPNQLPEVPFRVFAAGQYDFYRKPLPGTWKALERLFGDDNVEIGKDCLWR